MRPPISISEFTYSLPDDRIAYHPLAERDQSKLLYYHQGKIDHRIFKELPELLPSDCILFFNDTKVIPARLHFQKDTGAEIEIFLLNPVAPSTLLQVSMQSKESTTWKCTIGNLKRWSTDLILTKRVSKGEVHAQLIDRQEGIVKFSWSSGISFAEMIGEFGATPLPPYIKREAEQKDLERYQTVYSHFEGAVAAPTAGLHFTENVLNQIQQKGIPVDFLTLHVSAGTFQPVKVENALEHIMHSEQIVISKKNIQNLLIGKKVIAVGTTSMRSLESLYWYGVKLLTNPKAEFIITQNDPYLETSFLLSTEESLRAILQHMEKEELENIIGHTSIYILPGYSFKICKGLVTNFHQPGSTLMLLVAALVGKDWKKIYDAALKNDYRFLSYGDSSLLLP
ncbi:MAG TPA: S-adenosylmethionine:tRNA ribosyltransferase-isomerase [Cyclobacteriaceae bacterium]